MAKDRRDREVATRLQEVETTLPAPTEAGTASPAPGAEAGAPAEAGVAADARSGVEQRMMAAVEVLETLPVRERLGVLQAMLPVTLDEMDAQSRSSVMEELFLESELTPTT